MRDQDLVSNAMGAGSESDDDVLEQILPVLNLIIKVTSGKLIYSCMPSQSLIGVSTPEEVSVLKLSSASMDCLRLCLESSGCSPVSGSSTFRRCHSLLTDTTGNYQVTDAITRAFLKTNAIFFCQQQCNDSALCAGVQLILSGCVHDEVVTSVLGQMQSKLSVPTVVTGRGDITTVLEIFSILLCCAASSKDTNGGEAFTRGLVTHSALATIAMCLNSSGTHSSIFILAISSKKQFARLSILGQHLTSHDRMQSSIHPSCSAPMLVLASTSSLEAENVVESAILEIAFPLIPRTVAICDHLRGPATDTNMSRGHGIRDACVGLLDARLKCGGLLAVQQLCANGGPKLRIVLLAASILTAPQEITVTSQDHIGLSPEGVVWTVSGCISTFPQILLRPEHIKCIFELVSDRPLKFVKSWTGPGGGKFGASDTTITMVLLAFPFVELQNTAGQASANALVNSGFLLNVVSPGGKVCAEDKDIMKTIQSSMKMYIQFLLEVVLLQVELSVFILYCLGHVELQDFSRTVAIIAKLSTQKPLVQLVSKGLLDTTNEQRLTGPLSFPMVSDSSRKGKVIIPGSQEIITVFHVNTQCPSTTSTRRRMPPIVPNLPGIGQITLEAYFAEDMLYHEHTDNILTNFDSYTPLIQHLLDYMSIPYVIDPNQIPFPIPIAHVRNSFPFIFGMMDHEDEVNVDYIPPDPRPPRPRNVLGAPPLTQYVEGFTQLFVYAKMSEEYVRLGDVAYNEFRENATNILFLFW